MPMRITFVPFMIFECSSSLRVALSDSQQRHVKLNNSPHVTTSLGGGSNTFNASLLTTQNHSMSLEKQDFTDSVAVHFSMWGITLLMSDDVKLNLKVIKESASLQVHLRSAVRASTSEMFKSLSASYAVQSMVYDVTDGIADGLLSDHIVAKVSFVSFAKCLCCLGFAVIFVTICQMKARVEVRDGVESQKKQFHTHLSGVRAMLVMYIIWAHFNGGACEVDTPVSRLRSRVVSGVNCFVILSGFLSQRTSSIGGNTLRSITNYYFLRWCRIAGPYYTSLVLMLCIHWAKILVFEVPNIGSHLWRYIFLVQSWGEWSFLPSVDECDPSRCLRFVDSPRETVYEQQQMFKNIDDPVKIMSVSWTLSSLMFLWLLQPLLSIILKQLMFQKGFCCVSFMCLSMWIASILPGVITYLLYEDAVGTGFIAILYINPVAQLPSFCLGMCLQYLLDKYESSGYYLSETLCAAVADASALSVFVCLAFVPRLGRQMVVSNLPGNGFECIFYHGLGIFYAMYIFTSCISQTKSLTSRVLSTPVLSKLGKYSFAMYILEQPVYILVAAILQGMPCIAIPSLGFSDFCVGFVVLMAVSVICTEFIEEPVAKWGAQIVKKQSASVLEENQGKS